MNEFTHFLSGYLVARALKYKEDRFEALFLGLASVLPDIDSTINLFIPFEHGVMTHTLIGALLFAFLFSLFTYIFMKPLLIKTKTTFARLFLLAVIGVCLHLFLDIFTFHPGPCSIWLNPDLIPSYCNCPGSECTSVDDRHHLYFWPLWDFPVHLNTIFPYAWMTYEVRVWIEVIYTIFIGIITLNLWLRKRQNIFAVFNPSAWWQSTELNKTQLPSSIIIYAVIVLVIVVLPLFWLIF